MSIMTEEDLKRWIKSTFPKNNTNLKWSNNCLKMVHVCVQFEFSITCFFCWIISTRIFFRLQENRLTEHLKSVIEIKFGIKIAVLFQLWKTNSRKNKAKTLKETWNREVKNLIVQFLQFLAHYDCDIYFLRLAKKIFDELSLHNSFLWGSFQAKLSHFHTNLSSQLHLQRVFC